MTTGSRSDRIIVGVDGSAPSIDALRMGARIADSLDLPLEAITTWDYPLSFDTYYPSNAVPQVDSGQLLAGAVAEAFGGTPPRRFTDTALQGPPAKVLIEQSKNASMLVLGTRGRGGFLGLLLGSVSSSCASHAHCSVLIVRTPAPDHRQH